jgi:hypothetical protein
MKTKISKWWKFRTINLFGLVLAGKELTDKEERRFALQTCQMKDLNYIGYIIWFNLEWLVQLIAHGYRAVDYVCFTREWEFNKYNKDYLLTRNKLDFFKYLNGGE